MSRVLISGGSGLIGQHLCMMLTERDYVEAPVDIKITAMGPYENKSALTDSKGDYEINSLGNGTCNLEISKEG